MKEKHIKNQFCELIAACEELWHERKSLDFANNRPKEKQRIVNRLEKKIQSIQEILNKMPEEIQLIKDLYLPLNK